LVGIAAGMVYFIFDKISICVYSDMKMTAKRQQVCHEFNKLVAPIDAESFWLQLANAGVKISRAQVYNILNLMATQGSAYRTLDIEARLHYFQPLLPLP
jgi:Fe2+ or Zn2+ uptake regulation protein